ncbi:unnamed protein product [Umbelopsis vinacea]
MFTTYQYASPYPTRYVLDPFQTSHRYYSLEQELQDMYRQKLIEEERMRRAAAMEQALIEAYQRERAIRAAKERVIQRQMVERRRRQYQDYYENQLLNGFLGKLLSEDDDDEEMTEDYYPYEDCNAVQCRKRARLSPSQPEYSFRHTYNRPRSFHQRQHQIPQEQHQVWLLVQHLKDLDEPEATETPKTKNKGKTVEQDTQAAETSSNMPAAASEANTEDENQVNVDLVMTKLRNIGDRLDHIQEEHESVVLATPLTFDAESEDVVAKSAPNRQFLSYEDDIMKVLLELDAIESHGLAEIRNRRKELVAKSEDLLKVIDEYKQKEWERASSSSGNESDEEVDKETNENTPITDDNQATVLNSDEQDSALSVQEPREEQALLVEDERQEVTSNAQDSEDRVLPVNLDESMQLDTENEEPTEVPSERPVEEPISATEYLAQKNEDNEGIQHENTVVEVSEEEELEFENLEQLAAATSEEPSITNEPEHTTQTADEDTDFEMIDDQDLSPESKPQAEVSISSPKQTVELSKPVRIEIEWADE